MTTFGGQFNPTDPPRRSGVFINARTVELPRPRAGAAGTVGIVGQADWGPANQIVEITSPQQAASIYGTTGTLYQSIAFALQGEGLDDRSGAAKVLAYRIAGSALASATRVINNFTAGVAALTLTAKYGGTRGNSLTVTTQTNALDNTKRDLLIYEGTTLRESYTYNGTGGTILAALAADINANSNYVTATVNADGQPLAVVTNSAFAGGNSGSTILTVDHTAAQAAFEAHAGFGVFALDDWVALDNTNQTIYRDWTARLVREGTLFHMVVGGAASETPSTAIARSVFLDTPTAPEVLGIGESFINTTRDLRIAGTVYSSSRLASRYAGILSSADYQRSASNASIEGAEIVNPPTAAQLEALVRGGVTPYVGESGLVRTQRAVTTYGQAVTPTANKGIHFQETVFVRKLWQTYREISNMVSTKLIGQSITNTSSTRETILGMFEALLKDLEAREITVPEASVDFNPDFDNTGSTLHLIMTYRPAPTVEQVLAEISIPV